MNIKQSFNSSKLPAYDILSLTLAILVFVYIILRGIYVPPFSDEISTFFMYVWPGSYLPFEAHLDANNHFLNSFFTYIFYHLFGGHIFVLRLANILSFPIYVYYVWKTGRLFQSKHIAFFWFIAMMSSHYFLTFFHLSRGYGMSMAFFMGALYYLIIFGIRSKKRHMIFGLFMTALATWANLSLIIPCLITGFLFFLIWILNLEKPVFSFKTILLLIGIVAVYLIPMYYAVSYTLELQKAGSLYHGAGKGFIESFGVLLPFEFSRSFLWGKLLLLFMLSIMALAGIIILIRKRTLGPYFYVNFLLWSTLAGIYLLKKIMGVNYPEDRAAAYFFILLMITFCFSLDHTGLKFLNVFAAVPALALLIHMSLSLNLRYTDHWMNEAVPRSFYHIVQASYQKTGVLPTISGDELSGMAWDFYDFEAGGNLNNCQSAGYPFKVADFVIANNLCKDKPPLLGFDTLAYDQQTGFALLENQNKICWTPVKDTLIRGRSLTDESWELLNIPSDPYEGAPFCFEIEFTASSNADTVEWWLPFQLTDSSNNLISYAKIPYYRIRPDIRKAHFFHRRQFIDRVPENSKGLKIFFWNINRGCLNISNIRLRTFRGCNTE